MSACIIHSRLRLPELKEINGVVTDWNKIAAKELEKDPHAGAVNVEDLFSQKKRRRDGFQRMMIFIRTQKGYALIADRLYGIIEKQGLPAE